MRLKLVVRAGIEPATTCLEGRCSIRLSYRTTAAKFYNITPEARFFKESGASKAAGRGSLAGAAEASGSAGTLFEFIDFDEFDLREF